MAGKPGKTPTLETYKRNSSRRTRRLPRQSRHPPARHRRLGGMASIAQGPNGLSGEESAAEESAAQSRLLGTASPPGSAPSSPASPPASPGWRDRLRHMLQAHMPVTAGVLFPAAPSRPAIPVGIDEQLAVTAGHSTDDCAICLAPLGTCVTTPCNHSFHASCLEQYFLMSRGPGLRARCPLCRASVHAPLPVEVRAVSGRPIEVVPVPQPGGRCHYDRPYAPREREPAPARLDASACASCGAAY